MTHTGSEIVQVRAHNRIAKNLGKWTSARLFDVRASHGVAVLDLLLPTMEAGDIEISMDVDHSTVKLLVPGGAVIDADELRRIGKGRIKDWTGTPVAGDRRIRLIGEMRDSEVRIHRGGVAILSLLASRRIRGQVRDAWRSGRLDPVA